MSSYMQKIVSLVQAIKDLWPININKYSEIWAANYYEQHCIYIHIYIYIYEDHTGKRAYVKFILVEI